MRILSVYIFRKDGVPLVSRYYDIRAKQIDGLVTPFLASMTDRLESLTGETLSSISLQHETYMYVEEFGEIFVVAVVKGEVERKLDLDLVARRFYKTFHKTILGKNWTGRLDHFDKFIPIMEDILGIETSTRIISWPEKILDTFVLVDYSHDKQKIIRTIIKQGEFSVEQLRKYHQNYDIESVVQQLLTEKYLGEKEVHGSSYYFIRS